MTGEGVTVTINTANKATKTAAKFKITVPRNMTNTTKVYELLLHAGTSARPEDPSLDSETFTVTQSGPLASVSRNALDIYASKAGPYDVDLTTSNGLTLMFVDGNDYWWITSESGSDVLPDGISVTQISSKKVQGSSPTLNFELSECTGMAVDCTYKLIINVAENKNDAPTDRIPLTITQSRSLAKVSQTSYEIMASSHAESLTLVGLTFANNAAEWWITGENMGDLPAEITSVTPAMRATLNQGSLPRAFAYEVKENVVEARKHRAGNTACFRGKWRYSHYYSHYPYAGSTCRWTQHYLLYDKCCSSYECNIRI